MATATLALQRQLVERDLPRTVEALHPLLRRRPEFAMLKGRSNYLCLHRLHEGVPQDEEEGLFDQFEAAAPTSKLGQDLLRLRDWSDETETGDRDDLTPGRVRPRLGPGVGLLAGVPGRHEVRLRRRVLRRGGPRARQARRGRRHQPRAARDRRHRGRPGAPAARGADRRRGP